MKRLLVLGTPAVRDEAGHPLPGLAGQDKRLALLAWLAIERPDGVRRDALLPLFWPELDDPHARNALRQALALLRRELGGPAILGHGAETLSVPASALQCDAWEFEAHRQGGRPAEALALYRGDFLDGLHVPECAELSRWIDDRRERYRGWASAAAQEAAAAAAAAGRGEEALAHARRGVAIAPYGEAGWRQLLQLEAGVRGRASAMRSYEVLRQRLLADLDAAPEPATIALVHAIQQGDGVASFTPPAGSPASPAAEPTPAVSGAPPHALPIGRRRWRGLGFLVSGVAALSLLAVAFYARTAPPHLDRNLVYVDRFRTSGTDTTLPLLQEGLPELFTFLFTGVGGPRAVDPALTSRPQADTGANERSALARAASFRAAWLLRGSAVQVGPRLILNAQLLDVASSEVAAEGAAEGPQDSLLPMVERVAGLVLSGKARISPGTLADALTRSPAPLRRFLEGVALYRRGRYREATLRLRDAVALDSSFALAAVYMANASVWTGDGVILAEAVRLANRHADQLPPPLQALVRAYASVGTWAERRKAWELATRTLPNEPAAWERLGDQLFHEAGFLGDSAALSASAGAFLRAVALDSSRGTPLLHLMDLAARRGDTAGVRAWGTRFLRADTAGELRGYAEWRMRVASRGGASQFTEQDLARMTPASRREILGTAILDDLDPAILDPADRAIRAWMRQGTDQSPPSRTAAQLYLALLDRGESARAAAAGERMAEEERRLQGGTPPVLAWYTEVIASLYGGADRAVAARRIPGLEAIALAPAAPPGKDGPLLQAYAAAVLALWHQRESDPGAAQRFAERARRLVAAGAAPLARTTVATTLAILRAEAGGDGLAALDSLVRIGPLGNVLTEAAASLTLARGLAARGDTAAALAALARRRYYQPLPVFLLGFRREAARLSR